MLELKCRHFPFQDDTNLNEEQNVRYSRPWTRRFRAQSPDSPSITTTHVRHGGFCSSNFQICRLTFRFVHFSKGLTNGFVSNEIAALAASGATQTDLIPAVNQLLKLVDTMRTDVHQINSRINLLERSLAEVKNDQLRKKVTINIDITVLNYTTKTYTNKSKIVGLKYPKWWPFAEISPTWFILMLLWPFVAQRLINAVQRKK